MATTTTDEKATTRELLPLTQNDIAGLTRYFAQLPGQVAGQITQRYNSGGGCGPAVCSCTGDCDCPVRLEEQEQRLADAEEERFFLTMRRRLIARGPLYARGASAASVVATGYDAWQVLAAVFTPDARHLAGTPWGDSLRLLRDPKTLGPLAPLYELSALARIRGDALWQRARTEPLERRARQPALPPWRRREPCSTCAGLGVRIDRAARHAKPGGRAKPSTCPACDGKGHPPPPTREEWLDAQDAALSAAVEAEAIAEWKLADARALVAELPPGADETEEGAHYRELARGALSALDDARAKVARARRGSRLREYSPSTMIARVLEAEGALDLEPSAGELLAYTRDALVRAAAKGARDEPFLLEVRIELREIFLTAGDAYRRTREALGVEERKDRDARHARAKEARERLLDVSRERRLGRARTEVLDLAAMVRELME